MPRASFRLVRLPSVGLVRGLQWGARNVLPTQGMFKDGRSLGLYIWYLSMGEVKVQIEEGARCLGVTVLCPWSDWWTRRNRQRKAGLGVPYFQKSGLEPCYLPVVAR